MQTVESRWTVYAIKPRQVFDGDDLLTGDLLVIVEGDHIAAVQPADDLRPDGCEILEFPRATLLPGLIDAHVHLCCDSGPGALDRIPDATDDEMAAVIETSLRDQLVNGVTTVRDLGDRRYAVVAWRDRSGNRSQFPTVLASGPPITSPRGHCWNMGGEASGVDPLRRAVRERAERGVDIVKIMASGGANTPGTDVTIPQFTNEEIGVVVAEAHSAGLQVTAHAHALNAIRNVLDANVDGIEHCTFLTETGFDADERVIARLGESQTPVCPTLGFAPGTTLPPAIAELVRKSGLTPRMRATVNAQMHAAGVRLVGGSDAGINPGKHHGVLRESLIQLAEAGVSAKAVIASATAVGAMALGLEDRKGRLRPGLDADLLIVDGDPITDITSLRSVDAVFLRGQRVV